MLPPKYVEDNNPPVELAYGNALIIDNGLGAAYGSGAGVQGELAEKKDAIQRINTKDDYRKMVAGGILYSLTEPLFEPNGSAFPGVSQVTYIRAASTTAAIIDYTFENATLEVKCRHEGLVGNGYEDTGDTCLEF